MGKIIITDDDLSLCHFLKKNLIQKGHEVMECHSGEETLSMIEEKEVDLIFLDNKMPDLMGLELLEIFRQKHIKVPTIIMTAFGTAETAIEAMRLGAFDYILKPFELEEVLQLTEKGIDAGQLMKIKVGVPSLLEFQGGAEQIIGKSPAMQEVYKLIGQVTGTDITVLIQGESGTGKELVARAIYQHSLRKEGPFFAINCAAIPETLLESELFGYERGAFTGADKKRIGRFEQCDHGTILLDEISDMTLATQAKVLRVLQEGELIRIGGNETIRVDVRVLASANRKLDELVKEGRFREDLYYRLKIITINLPPLRERKEDIQELTEYFFRRYKPQLGKAVSHIHPAVFDKLRSYHWPGNIRELSNAIKRALILCKGEVLTEEEVVFEKEEQKMPLATDEEVENMLNKKMDPIFTELFQLYGKKELHSSLLNKMEKILIKRALTETRGNQVQAAKILGISRNTLRNRVGKYGL